MRLVTWNVNSLTSRLPRIVAMLEREQPDIVCLQETKTLDDEIPSDLADAGYVVTSYGQRPYNGVAILSRAEPDQVIRGFPGDPVADEARVLTARFGELTVIDVYVVNGRDIDDPMYEVKLEWLAALRRWIAETFDPSDQVIVAGDFNIAPDDRDVWDPVGRAGTIHCSEPERAELRRWFDWGFVDLFRLDHDEGGVFSWWDYRGGAFHQGRGLRIDLILGTKPMAGACREVRIDRNERRPTAGEGNPSDHAPVIATFTDV